MNFEDAYYAAGDKDDDENTNEQEGIMPPPWERYYSEEDEQFYYFHPETEQCLWENDLFEMLGEEGFLDDGNEESDNEEDDNIDDSEEQEEEPPPPPPPPTSYPYLASAGSILQNDQDEQEEESLDLLALANMDIMHSADTPPIPPQAQLISSRDIYQSINDPTLSVVDRSNITMQAKQQKIFQTQQSQLQSQAQSLTGIPVTSKKAQSMPKRSVEDMMEWEEARRQRLHRTKALLRAQAEAEVTGKPTLTKKAQEVSKKWQSTQQQLSSSLEGAEDGQSVNSSSTTGTRSVADRLWDYEERKKEKLERMQQAKDQALRQSAIPRIAPKSNKILAERRSFAYPNIIEHSINANPNCITGRDEDENGSVSQYSMSNESHVSQRLYALAQLRQQQSDSNSVSWTPTLTQHDPSTGQRYFAPKINPVSENLAQRRRRQQLRQLLNHNIDNGHQRYRAYSNPGANNNNSSTNNMAIEDLLQAQGALYQKKLADKEERRRLQEEKQRKISKVNAVSAKIVQDKYILYGETTQDRLQQQIGQKIKAKTLATIDQPTFTPKISDSSVQILQSSGYRHLYFGQDAESLAAAEREKLTAVKQQQQDHMKLIEQYSVGAPNIYDYGPESGDYQGGAVMVEAGQATLNPQQYGYSGDSFNYNTKPTASQGRNSNSNSSKNAVYERSKLWEVQRQRKLERDRLNAEKKEKEICSFKPKVSANSIFNGGDRLLSGSSMNNRDNIAERHQQWLQQKELRLQAERKKNAEEAIKECTFVPRVPVPTKSSSGTHSSSQHITNSNTSSSSVHSGGSGSQTKSTNSRQSQPQSPVSSKHIQQKHLTSSLPQMTGYEDFATPFAALVPKSPKQAQVKFRTQPSSVPPPESSPTRNGGGAGQYVSSGINAIYSHNAQSAHPTADTSRSLAAQQYASLRARGPIDIDDYNFNPSQHRAYQDHDLSPENYTTDMNSLEQLARLSLSQQQNALDASAQFYPSSTSHNAQLLLRMQDSRQMYPQYLGDDLGSAQAAEDYYDQDDNHWAPSQQVAGQNHNLQQHHNRLHPYYQQRQQLDILDPEDML
jgi:hypothetical protein